MIVFYVLRFCYRHVCTCINVSIASHCNVSTLLDVDDVCILGLESPSSGFSAITQWSLALSWERG